MANKILENDEKTDQTLTEAVDTLISNSVANLPVAPSADTSVPVILNPQITSPYFKVDPSGDIFLGNYAGGQGVWWDMKGDALHILGGLTVDHLDIPDIITANSFHVDVDGNVWWGATTLAGSLASVTKAGVATFKNVILNTSVQISNIIAGSEISIQGWIHTLTFSVTDLDTVAWSTGSIKLMDGTTYTISAGNTGNMSAETYIYLDVGVSTTVLQTTTTKTNAVGSGKILICVAQNGATEASFVDFGSQAQNIPGTSIVTGSITANEIAANTITANKMSVSSLSAISANIGTITSGTITIDTSGYIRGGQTDYNIGIGFFLGYSGGAYKFSIGNPAGQYFNYDGSKLTFIGNEISIRNYIAGETITIGQALFISSGSETFTLVDISTSATGTISFGLTDSGYGEKVAQTFKAPVGIRTLNSIDIKLKKQGNPTDNVKVSIQTLSGGNPSGTILCYGTIAGTSLTTTSTVYTLTTNIPYLLTGGTSYAVVFDRTGSYDDTNYYKCVSATDHYADGEALYTNLGVWTNGGGVGDLYCVIKEVCTAGKLYLTSAVSAVSSNTFIGFSLGNYNPGDSVSVIVGSIADNLTGLSVGSIYYLSDTFGTISTSAGSTTKKVGLALSATELRINYTI